MRILILGGTGEARRLAERLVDLGHDVTTSLAGRTSAPTLPPGEVRIGPLGGVGGLAALLRERRYHRLVVATHPFAKRISAGAVEAAALAGVRLVRYMRPGWSEGGETWTRVDTLSAAAAALPAGAVVLVTTGHHGLGTLLRRVDCRFLVRLIERPASTLPEHASLILGRPPHSVEAERALMADHGVTHLVAKDSGGIQTRAKLDAARELGVQVILIERPRHLPAVEATSLEAVVAALDLSDIPIPATGSSGDVD